MPTSPAIRRSLAALAALALFAAGGPPPPARRRRAAPGDERARVALPALSKAVNLSHVNDPSRTPIFPGDPPFTIETVFAVENDGYYLELVTEGTHTGTHYSAPCHFHEGALCMDDLSPPDLVLPAVALG